MKKIFIMLSCLIALSSCDKINFYEKDIQCLDPISQQWIHYDYLKVNSKEAILMESGKKIVLKRYISEEHPEGFIFYKNVKEEMPLFLHYAKNIQGIGMSTDKLGPCGKDDEDEDDVEDDYEDYEDED